LAGEAVVHAQGLFVADGRGAVEEAQHVGEDLVVRRIDKGAQGARPALAEFTRSAAGAAGLGFGHA
jgi:hypothetical protein